MEKTSMLHQGKVKAIWATADPQLCIAQFSDRITAGDGAKKAVLPGKGALLNKISSLLFIRLAEKDSQPLCPGPDDLHAGEAGPACPGSGGASTAGSICRRSPGSQPGHRPAPGGVLQE